MRRFFVEPGQLQAAATVELAGDEFHHLRNVSRLEEGERVELLDGEGHLALAMIEKLGKKSAQLKIEKVETLPPPSRPNVEIVLCMPRFQKVDLIIQKAVELGAAKISPVVSDRSFVKTVSRDLEGKVKRWQKIAAEACKQSGRAWPMQIDNVDTLINKMAHVKKGEGLFLYEGEAATNIKSALSDLDRNIEKLTLFIGAEGGFSAQEVRDFTQVGLAPVTLGALVLRVETACIAILSVIQYDFGNMS